MPTDTTCQQQLEQLRKEFEEFAYIVSHDFKAPIRAISNLSHWIEEDLGEDISEDVQHNMLLLRNRSKRLEGMIEALLQYSRVNRYNLETATCNLKETLQEVAAAFEGQAILNLPENLPTFYTYCGKLTQVLQSVVANAVKFSGKDKTYIAFSCVDTGDGFYEFALTDSGCGVPDDALEKIFTLFYTVAPKDTVDTVGAGLAISKKITQFVKGNISAENNPENGLTIKFTWPKELETIK